MTRIISIANQKGGVGKTTTAINLAACLAELGQKTLIIDMDPQGNASSGLGFYKDEVERGISDVLLGMVSLNDVLLPTNWEQLYIIPATRDLIGTEFEMIDLLERELRLKELLSDLEGDFAYVIIDCPPSLGLLTVNSLAASHSVIIPLQAQYYAMEGLGELLRSIAAFRQGLNPQLVREGVLITMADAGTNLAKEVENQAREVFGQEVFEAVIPRNIRLAECPSFAKPVIYHDPKCRGSIAYRQFAAELLTRHGVSFVPISERVAS